MEGFTPAEQEIRGHADDSPPVPPTPRQRYIDGLRVLAAVLEDNPDIPLPYHGSLSEVGINFLGGEDPRGDMAAAARAIPCKWDKETWGGEEHDYFTLKGQIAGLKVSLTAYRDTVCKRIVTGTEMREVDEVVTPAVTRKVKKPVDIVTWDCGPILAPRLPDAAPKVIETSTEAVPAETSAVA